MDETESLQTKSSLLQRRLFNQKISLPELKTLLFKTIFKKIDSYMRNLLLLSSKGIFSYYKICI